MKKFGLTIGIIVVVVLIGFFLFGGQPSVPDNTSGSSSSESVPPANGGGGSTSGNTRGLRSAPTFSFEDDNGNIVSSSDFEGKPLVLNSWAVWCPFCRQELPDFAAAQEEFGEAVTIIAIDRAESLSTTKRYTDELNVTDKLVFLLDPKDSFYKSIGGFSMPETLFVNSEGNIVHHKRGVMELPEIREKINDIL